MILSRRYGAEETDCDGRPVLGCALVATGRFTGLVEGTGVTEGTGPLPPSIRPDVGTIRRPAGSQSCFGYQP